MRLPRFPRHLVFSAFFFGLWAFLFFPVMAAAGDVMWVLPGWGSVSALCLSLAYFGTEPELLGKREDGTIESKSLVMLAPYLLLTRVVWNIQNWFAGGNPASLVMPGLYVGRLCEYRELPPGVTRVIDLTAEFPTPRSIRTRLPLHCLPTLDGCPPDREKMTRLFAEIPAEGETLYVCCANGAGRSVTLAAALILARETAAAPDEVLRRIRASRPVARPNRDQVASLG